MTNFFRAYIEITNICGLECSFCPPKIDKPKNMGLDTFESILQQLKADEIALHVMGDPLTRSNLKEYLDLAQKYNFKVSLTTSGFYIKNHDFSTLLHSSIDQLNISLNSFNKNVSKLTLDEYLNPIFSLINYKLKNNIDKLINLRLWNLDNQKSEDYFNNEIFSKIYQKFKVDVSLQQANRSVRVACKVRVHFDEYFEWPTLNNPIYKNSRCLGLNKQIAFLSDGRVTPCCFDSNGYVNLGDIKTTSFDTILKNSSDIAKGLRDGNPTEDLCKRCSYRLRFLKDSK